MSAARQFFTDIANAKRRMTAALTATPVDDDEMECRECAGTGLDEGPDGPPCQYCDGSGVW